MGIALPLIAGMFLAYCLFGEYLPSPLNHRGYSFSQVIDHMAFGTEGIYGIPTYVSSTYIFLFILFGSFLERAGMIRLFTDVAMGLFGHKQGGAAKVAVVSSGLMGTISGSGVANVVTTGQFTIPLMKKFGYRPAFAGGRRGDRVDGRADHAAGHGGRGLHHGRDAGRGLYRSREGRADPGDSLLRLGLLDGAPGGRTLWPAGSQQGRSPLRPQGDRRELDAARAARCAGLPAVRGLHAALCRDHRAGADGAADPWRIGRAEPARGRHAPHLLDLPRPRRRRVPAIRHRRPDRGPRGPDPLVRPDEGRDARR